MGRKINNPINQVFKTKKGFEIEIIEYFSSVNITVKFLKDNKIKTGCHMNHIKNGNISHPDLNYSNGNLGKSYGRLWKIYETNNFGKIQIIEYFNASNVTVKFLEDDSILKGIQFSSIESGYVKNPNKIVKTIHGIGYDSGGKYVASINSKATSVKIVFQNMIQRCYSENSLENRTSYIGCSVVDEWHDFQTFAEWYENNYIDGWFLDKDILIKGNKIYGPDTCCFVPSEINLLLTKSDSRRGKYPIGVSEIKNSNNKYKAILKKFDEQIYLGIFSTPELAFNAYKIEKEKHIKKVAEIWKDKIPSNIYKALINYKVEITD